MKFVPPLLMPNESFGEYSGYVSWRCPSLSKQWSTSVINLKTYDFGVIKTMLSELYESNLMSVDELRLSVIDCMHHASLRPIVAYCFATTIDRASHPVTYAEVADDEHLAHLYIHAMGQFKCMQVYGKPRFITISPSDLEMEGK